MPLTWESPVAGGWGQAVDWGAPSPPIEAGNDPSEKQAGSPTGPWGAQATWDIPDTVSPFAENSVFTDRWQAASSSLVPFWAKNVAAADHDSPIVPLATFLDEMALTPETNLWRGIRSPKEKWSVREVDADEPPETPEHDDSDWGSELSSRPRTPTVTGKERERSKAAKLAQLDRKGIFWEELDLNGPPTTPNSGESSSTVAVEPAVSCQFVSKKVADNYTYTWKSDDALPNQQRGGHFAPVT